MIALIPLDDRPCNFRFPAEIAAIGGTEIVMPPSEALGRFQEPGNCRQIAEWLESLEDVGTLIVSVDMLAYGGLVASRRSHTSLEEAVERLQVLRRWHRAHPGVRILAFNVLMRLAVTMDSDAAIPHYYNVMRWARLADEATRFGSDYLREQLVAVEAEIPAAVLDDYRAARARNHAVNLLMVDFLADDVVDFLLITQEDCTEYGLHRLEQTDILNRVAGRDVADRFTLHPGADEAALTLLARSWRVLATFELRVSRPGDMRHIAAFEDRPYDEALGSHIRAVGGAVTEGEADFQLWINAPVGNSQKDENPEAKAERKAALNVFVAELEASIAAAGADSRAVVCDVAFPNGADDMLMRELERRELLGKLLVFGAWNTAGNTTGTVLAQCLAIKQARLQQAQNASEGDAGDSWEASMRANRRFLFERLLDDWCYQTLVRPRAEKAARERNLSPLNMGNCAGPVEAAIRLELGNMGTMLAARQFGTRLERLDVHLPWDRTFEAEIGARLT